MNTGIIKFFNAAKGFGFVTPDGGGADLFLPAATVTAAGVTRIRPGQRITFEQAPDTRGPKVVSLKLVGDAPAKAPAAAAEQVIVYCDASADVTADVVEAVRDSGFSLMIQDYVTASAGMDHLKRLSQLLSVSGQSLVRRYDPLFLALQLDDRFITDQDFWTAIAEHPVLINGPVLFAAGRARICKTAAEVRAFLRKDDTAAAAKPKTLSPRIAAMLKGEALPDAGLAEPQASQATAKPSSENKPRSSAKEKSSAKLKRKVVANAAKAPKATSKTAAKPAKKAKKRAKK